MATVVLPYQVLQASLVGTAGPTPPGLPDPEPEELMQGLGTRVVTPPTTKTKPIPGSATNLFTFALQILKTDLPEAGAMNPILMVFCGISVRPLSALF